MSILSGGQSAGENAPQFGCTATSMSGNLGYAMTKAAHAVGVGRAELGFRGPDHAAKEHLWAGRHGTVVARAGERGMDLIAAGPAHDVGHGEAIDAAGRQNFDPP